MELDFEKGSGKNWQGRRISLVTITPAGKKLIGGVIHKHKKVVTAWMRALDSREQDTLARLCWKLRRGDIVKFVKHIRTMHPDDFYAE